MKIEKTLLILSIAGLSACNAMAPLEDTTMEKKSYVYVPETAVSVSCVTHEGSPSISQFYVGELTRKRMAGGGSCGGLIAAGYLLPNTWHPGMTVKVRWKPNGRDFIEKTTNILRYDEVGNIYVHFFAGDHVRVVSALPYPESRNHPIPEDAIVPPPEGEFS